MANTTIKMVGPAAHVASADKDLAVLQGFDKNRSSDEAAKSSILIENNKNDFIGSLIGWNPYTTKTNTGGKDDNKTENKQDALLTVNGSQKLTTLKPKSAV